MIQILKIGSLSLMMLLTLACGKTEFGGDEAFLDKAEINEETSIEPGPPLIEVANNPSLLDQYACGKPSQHKVLVCHFAGPELCISVNALDAHLAHGTEDTLGKCPVVVE